MIFLSANVVMKVLVVLTFALLSGKFIFKEICLDLLTIKTVCIVVYSSCFSSCPSGCQANLFYADAPKPQLEVLTDAFWDYVAKATQTADDTLQMIRKSQFGQDVRWVRGLRLYLHLLDRCLL